MQRYEYYLVNYPNPNKTHRPTYEVYDRKAGAVIGHIHDADAAATVVAAMNEAEEQKWDRTERVSLAGS